MITTDYRLTDIFNFLMLKRYRYFYWLRYGIDTYEYINVQKLEKISEL